eukprot:jgi/Undpi1/7460/HiC_scaffold_22.g09933.m1
MLRAYAGATSSVNAGPYLGGATLSSEKLLACHKYSRAVRVLAVLDAVVVLYGASAFTPLILMIWGPIAGYVSSTFRLRAANAFLFYYGLRVCWDIGWLLSGGITWIVVWVFLVTNAAASGLVYLYVVLLRKCTPSEITGCEEDGRMESDEATLGGGGKAGVDAVWCRVVLCVI